jgi:hypothetical protein
LLFFIIHGATAIKPNYGESKRTQEKFANNKEKVHGKWVIINEI